MEFHQLCGDVFGSGPKKTVQKLAAAGQNSNVTQLFEEKASLLRVECKKGSLSSVASGLLRERDVAAQAGCGRLQIPGHFQDPWNSCQLRRVCQMGVHTPFHGDQLVVPDRHANAQGHARGHLRATGGPALPKVLLTDEWVRSWRGCHSR